MQKCDLELMYSVTDLRKIHLTVQLNICPYYLQRLKNSMEVVFAQIEKCTCIEESKNLIIVSDSV